MENFEYSIQLSDKDWADFSEAAEECGLLQAALASGDEPLSSDIDQGDSSGSSPPGPPPPRFLRVRAGSPLAESLLKVLDRRSLPGHLATAQGGCSGSEEEEGPDVRLVSRFRCERVLASGAGQQTRGTSTPLEEQLHSTVLCPDQLTPALVPGSTMQKSLQGEASQASEVGVHSGKDPPSQGPSGQGQSSSLGLVDGKRSPREPNPGASPRSPGKKKRRSVGAKGSGSPKAQDTKRQAPPSPSVALPPSSGSQSARSPSTGAHSILTPVDLEGNGPGFESGPGATGLGTKSSWGIEPQGTSSTPDLGPEAGVNGSTPAPLEQTFLDLSSPVSKTETRVNMSTSTRIPKEGENLSLPVSLPEKSVNLTGEASEVEPSSNPSPQVSKEKLHKDVFTSDTKTNSDLGLPMSIPKLEPERHQSTHVLLANADVGPATPIPKVQPDVKLSTPVPQVQPDVKLSTPVPQVQPDVKLCTPDCKPEPIKNLSPSSPRARADVDVSSPDHRAEPDRNLSISALGARAGVSVSTPVPITRSFNFPVSPQGLHGEPEKGNRAPLSPGALGEPSLVSDGGTPSPGIVTPAPRRKKVRFSGISSSPQEDSASASPSSVLSDSAASESPRTLGAGRGGPRVWDAVAVGLRPQPRILKHPPSPSVLARDSAGPREDYALTLPEAYDYFFCDTIVEEEEEEEEDIPSNLQWPEVCEYFFWDNRHPGQRPLPGPPLQVPARVDPVPISIPEAYEHFFGEEGPSENLLPPNWVPVTLSNEQTLGPERAPLQVWPRVPAPEDQNPPKTEELGLTVSLEGEQRAPFIPITFNQNDMCLGFVAFATWAVRTSDLHAPDAWKTVLLANIGAISAIRYFRRQAREGRPSL
ncbi:PGC-1 and ERR-induced regulator in muscle protein 1 isoform X2 [Macrotis lagotis]